MTSTAPIPGLDRPDVPAGDRELTATLVAGGPLVRLTPTALGPVALPVVAPGRVLTAARRTPDADVSADAVA